MTYQRHGNAFDNAMELLIENGFDRVADVLQILLSHVLFTAALKSQERKATAEL